MKTFFSGLRRWHIVVMCMSLFLFLAPPFMAKADSVPVVVDSDTIVFNPLAMPIDIDSSNVDAFKIQNAGLGSQFIINKTEDATSPLPFIFLAFCGAIVMLVMNLNTALARGEVLTSFLLKNIPAVLTNIVAASAILYVSYGDPAPILPVTKVTALLLGATGQEILKRFFQAFHKDVPTKVGINTTPTAVDNQVKV